MAEHGHHDSHDTAHGAPAEGGKVLPLPEARLIARYTAGGHEIDHTPSKSLFIFLGVMVAILLLSGIFVYQLFVGHSEGDLKRAADQPASQLVEQHAKEDQLLSSYGKVEREGQVVGFRMPVAAAQALVVRDSSRFAPAPPPAGWVHPDDATKK